MKRLQKVCFFSNKLILHFVESEIIHYFPVHYLPKLILVLTLKKKKCVSAGPRPPLIRHSLPPDVPPGAAPDLLLTSADRKKKQRERGEEENEQMDKNALYDIVSSPSKDSARLTLKLSRVKIPDMDQSGDQLPPRAHMDSNHETDLMNNNQLSRDAHDLSHRFGAEEQVNCQQVPLRPNTKEIGVSVAGYDDAEIDALAEIDRIERESAGERERWSKEVQDKGEFLLLPCAIFFFPAPSLFVFVERLRYSLLFCRQTAEETEARLVSSGIWSRGE